MKLKDLKSVPWALFAVFVYVPIAVCYELVTGKQFMPVKMGKY